MSRKVTFHRLASRELNDAAQYYESASAGLGEAFLQEIERCIRHIVLYPRAGVVLSGEIRPAARCRLESVTSFLGSSKRST